MSRELELFFTLNQDDKDYVTDLVEKGVHPNDALQIVILREMKNENQEKENQ